MTFTSQVSVCSDSTLSSIETIFQDCLAMMNSVDLELLRTFVVAASAPTFREAAVRRRVSVSAISQQVKVLEGQLGIPLFERIGRRARLTASGQSLRATLTEDLARIDEALEAASSAHHEAQGRVTIGAPRPF